MRRFATVLLVDARDRVGGRVLNHALIDPDRGGLVGGHVEPGESLDEAVLRELAEETGLRVGPDELTTEIALWRTFVVHDTRDEMAVYVGASAAADPNVVCGEGRQIVFVDPADVASLPLTQAAAEVIPPFLGSQTYESLHRR